MGKAFQPEGLASMKEQGYEKKCVLEMTHSLLENRPQDIHKVVKWEREAHSQQVNQRDPRGSQNLKCLFVPHPQKGIVFVPQATILRKNLPF